MKTSDNADIGDIELVGNEFIVVVRQGEVKIHRYYIPKSCINNYDGSAVYVATPSGLVVVGLWGLSAIIPFLYSA